MRFGTRRMTAAGLAMAAVLVLAGTAACQGGTRMRSEMVDHNHRVSIHTTGEVRFTDDDRGVAYVEPGARMVIEEERPGQPDRRVEFRGRAGGFDRAFFRDGRRVEPTADDEAWIARSILQPIRESGRHAAERAARIFRRGGTDAVLAEIAMIGSDGAKRAYYTALLRQPLRAGETARVLRDAGRRIGSDGDKRAVLATVLDGSVGDEEMAAMLDAAGTIGSDGDKSSLLVRAAGRDALGDDAVRQAFFRTATRIGSDGDKSRVLMAVLANGGARRDAVADALRAARTIGSDGDKSRVLTSVPPRFLRDAAVRGAYETAMQGIGSDGDRSRVAVWLARSLP